MSAKYAMRYFATVAGNEQETAIERRILSTNPIMEVLLVVQPIRNEKVLFFASDWLKFETLPRKYRTLLFC